MYSLIYHVRTNYKAFYISYHEPFKNKLESLPSLSSSLIWAISMFGIRHDYLRHVLAYNVHGGWFYYFSFDFSIHERQNGLLWEISLESRSCPLSRKPGSEGFFCMLAA